MLSLVVTVPYENYKRKIERWIQMNQVYQNVQAIYESIKEQIPFTPKLALVLGSGLGDFAESIQIKKTINYSEIKNFPVSTVPGHKGRFVFGYVDQVPVVIMQGRVHYYEGYSIQDVVLPIRLMQMMGAEVLFLTNASGGINENYEVGDFMLISDHISIFVPNPLIGPNIEEFGVRFPDMSEVYKKDLNAIIRETSKRLHITLREGVYTQLTGPSYESASEIRMLRTLGSDAVGMSTVCEAIVANHMGMKVCGISCITNMACGILDQPLSHAEVQETADKVALLFKQLITESIMEIGKM